MCGRREEEEEEEESDVRDRCTRGRADGGWVSGDGEGGGAREVMREIEFAGCV